MAEVNFLPGGAYKLAAEERGVAAVQVDLVPAKCVQS